MTTIRTTLLLFLAVITFSLQAEGQPDMKVAIQTTGVELHWTSVDEATSYVVEMATEVNDLGELLYEQVAFVEANHSGNVTYFVEELQADGIVYFRVKQFDRWGNEIASNSSTANYLLKDSFTSNIAANADFSALYIDLNTTASADAEIVVSSPTGEEAYRGVFAAQKGLNTYDINLDQSLVDGFYVVTINCNNASQNVLLEKEAAPSFMVTVD